MFNFLKKKSGSNQDKEIEDQETVAGETGQNLPEEEIKISEDITVHTMPERFRFSHLKIGKTKKIGLLIMAGAAVFLIMVAAGLYFYLFKAGPKEAEEIATTTPLATDLKPVATDQLVKPVVEPKNQPVAIKQPKEVFLAMKSELDKVSAFNNYENYEQVIKKYSSQTRRLEIARQKKEHDSLSDSDKADFMALLASSSPELEAIEDIQERQDANQATLQIIIKGVKESGIITMVLENSEWKIESENWPKIIEPADSAAATSTVSFITAADSDKDGLTDKEEALLGCDLNSQDSDKDGHNDLSEVINLYNPAGNDRLINNPGINVYLNNSFN